MTEDSRTTTEDSKTMTDATDATTLVQCEDCGAVIPVIVRATGEPRPIGTGGDCTSGKHAFSLRGEELTPRQRDASTDTAVYK